MTYILVPEWDLMKGYGTGIWKSTDNGLTWNETGLNSQSFDTSFIVPKILQHPTKSTLLAILNFGNQESKIMKTYNGGDAWYTKYTKKGNPQMELFDTDMNPQNQNIIIAGGKKLIFSSNLGESWIDITSRVIDTNVYKLNRDCNNISPC
ncbi:MAG: hypothetical protein M9948_08985 [Lentimicrobium sp.]|nr:hypothetical protein [Lentimicrobium sp.]